jgi:transposase
MVGYARRNFMVTLPSFNSWEEFNAHLAEQRLNRRERRLRGHAETIGERFECDRALMLPLPATGRLENPP